MRSLNATAMLEEEDKQLGKRDIPTTSRHFNANGFLRSLIVLCAHNRLKRPLALSTFRSVFACSLEGQHFEPCWVR
ncbi:hypothetical protein EGR_11020 [Echinococcus granulosus]|uniref:Uncharacterized protein n=1 Tax=Echinococcus granulosus TaxID=6210 RepID=W6TZ95_ECHGR|nr:hypothetical protein EGR_11020 [Echinococcus granulosus]EUB54120.1 hypothetical protein EGR_11020 [Echinococcus granulosus]